MVYCLDITSAAAAGASVKAPPPWVVSTAIAQQMNTVPGIVCTCPTKQTLQVSK